MIKYKVKKGDTLSEIEKKLDVPKAFRKWTMKASKIKDPDKIYPKQVLRLPETFSEIKAIAGQGKSRLKRGKTEKQIIKERTFPKLKKLLKKKKPSKKRKPKVKKKRKKKPEPKKKLPKWILKGAARELKEKKEVKKAQKKFEKIVKPKKLKSELKKLYNFTSSYGKFLDSLKMRKGEQGEVEITIFDSPKAYKLHIRPRDPDVRGVHETDTGLISILKSKPSVVFHESLHAFWQKKKFKTEDFSKDWEEAQDWEEKNILLDRDKVLKKVEKRVASLDLGNKQKVEERFAYLTEHLGGVGEKKVRLEDIPAPLRKYYKGVLGRRKGYPAKFKKKYA